MKSLKFDKISRNLQRIASASFPKAPKKPIDIRNLFDLEAVYTTFGVSKEEIPQPFYRATIDEPNYSFCIFASSKIMGKLKFVLKHHTK